MELKDTRSGHPEIQNSKPLVVENHQNHRESAPQAADTNDADGLDRMDSKMFDLNMKPHRMH